MDAVTLGTAILGGGAVSAGITQVAKRWIPTRWRALFALAVALVVAVVAVALTGGFSERPVGLIVAAVIGVAQALYAVTKRIVGAQPTEVDDEMITAVLDYIKQQAEAKAVAQAAAPTIAAASAETPAGAAESEPTAEEPESVAAAPRSTGVMGTGA